MPIVQAFNSTIGLPLWFKYFTLPAHFIVMIAISPNTSMIALQTDLFIAPSSTDTQRLILLNAIDGSLLSASKYS